MLPLSRTPRYDWDPFNFVTLRALPPRERYGTVKGTMSPIFRKLITSSKRGMPGGRCACPSRLRPKASARVLKPRSQHPAHRREICEPQL